MKVKTVSKAIKPSKVKPPVVKRSGPPLTKFPYTNHPGPGHGVSGYPITGVAGDFNLAYVSPGITTGNMDPSASRYDLQASTSIRQLRSGSNNFSEWLPAKIATPSTAPVSNFTSEPVLESSLAAGSSKILIGSLARNQRLQAQGRSMGSSYLDHKALNNLYGDDMYLQSQLNIFDKGVRNDALFGDSYAMHQGVQIHLNPRPYVPPRQDLQNSGSVNAESSVPVSSPTGQSSLHDINDFHTPAVTSAGYSDIATHPAHGPLPAQRYDGSWTLDMAPGVLQQPSLLNLPPAADIPVQTYTGYGPQSTSISAARPWGGSMTTPSTRVAAVFG